MTEPSVCMQNTTQPSTRLIQTRSIAVSGISSIVCGRGCGVTEHFSSWCARSAMSWRSRWKQWCCRRRPSGICGSRTLTSAACSRRPPLTRTLLKCCLCGCSVCRKSMQSRCAYAFSKSSAAQCRSDCIAVRRFHACFFVLASSALCTQYSGAFVQRLPKILLLCISFI